MPRSRPSDDDCRRRRRRSRRPRRRARPIRRDLPPVVVPSRARDGAGEPLREAGRRRRRSALPPPPGRLLVRAARHGPGRPPRSPGRVADRRRHAGARPRRRTTTTACSSPPGVAHGFASLTDVLSVVPGRQLLQPQRRAGCGLGRSRDRASPWGIEAPVLSARDQSNPRRAELDPSLQPRYGLRT